MRQPPGVDGCQRPQPSGPTSPAWNPRAANATLAPTMKAIIQTRYGSIDDLELRDVAEPTAGEREVLVRVRAASVHPDVWHVVSGGLTSFA